MPSFFVSKFEKRYRLATVREKGIQKIQLEKGCSREYATRFYDYERHANSHIAIKLTSSALYMYGAHRLCKMLSTGIPLFQRDIVRGPIYASGFYLGWRLYDKLVNHYFNHADRDVAHTWEVDLQEKYRVKDPENVHIPLTPFDRMKEGFVESLNHLHMEGEKVYRRLSKDKNDFFYLFGKIRNLENIVYLSNEEIEKIKNPLELQMKIDAVKPLLIAKGEISQHVDSLHEVVEDYKRTVENSRNFRSIKDKFLGLPFMMKRHQQYPIPQRGSWQFDIFEQMFGEPYDYYQGKHELEEKINKYNYHLFLHPSVIAKFDTNSEEFDMYLRQLNFESKTNKEERALRREYFSKRILPVLNLTDNKEAGSDFANYVINRDRSNDYGNYLYKQYSGQREEELFREAEESKYVNKNEPFVQRISNSTILKGRIGIRANELNELLSNPTQAKKMRKALEHKYPFYEPTKFIDQLRFDANQTNYYNTIIEREVDTTSPDFKFEDLEALQYDKGEGGDNPEEEAIASNHVNAPFYPGKDFNTYPYNRFKLNLMYYNPNLDWNDYASDQEATFISPKNRRFEMFANMNQQVRNSLYYRNFNNAEFADKRGFVIPYLDYANEELKSRVLFRSNYHRFVDNSILRDSDKEKLEFLEEKTMQESYDLSDDLTEEELDQALFEASYNKPYYESEEFKGLTNRNNREVEQLFKVLNFEPFEMWNEKSPVPQIAQGIPYTDKAQMLDPLVNLYSEVEQPVKMRQYIKKWRSGAEMRFKLPYYPETKQPEKTFNYH